MLWSLFMGMSVFLGGIILLVLNWNHFLVSLLSLEFMSLGVYMLMSLDLSQFLMSFMSLFFISLCVCESCLGISILVMCTFCKGSGSMGLFSSLSW